MKKKKVKPVTQALNFSLPKDPKGAQSTREIVKDSGMKKSWVKARLQEMDDAGILRHGRRNTPTIDGRMCAVPVYWVED